MEIGQASAKLGGNRSSQCQIRWKSVKTRAHLRARVGGCRRTTYLSKALQITPRSTSEASLCVKQFYQFVSNSRAHNLRVRCKLKGHGALKHRSEPSSHLCFSHATPSVFLPLPSLCRQAFIRPTFPVSASLCLISLLGLSQLQKMQIFHKAFERHLLLK